MTAADATRHDPAAEDAARAAEAARLRWLQLADTDEDCTPACDYCCAFGIGWAGDPPQRWYDDDCQRAHRAGRRARRAYERRRAEGGAP